jgi:N-acetylmuramoyl-L-alanine amidase
MRLICSLIQLLGLSFVAMLAHAQPVQIGAINYNNVPPRLSFDLSSATHPSYFTLSQPSRLVIDFKNTRQPQALAPPPTDHPLFQNIRSGKHNGNDLRVVVELKADADAKASLIREGAKASLQFSLTAKPAATQTEKARPGAGKPLATTKVEKGQAAAVTTHAAEQSAGPKQQTSAKPAVKPISVLEPETQSIVPASLKVVKSKGRDIVVAIDAGHGGKDVGARGARGTHEKDVVFAIAKRLEGMVNRQPGMRGVMIRKGDNFVYLSERVRIARAAKADLFVSIHADAFNDPTASGASVYTLAKRGASSADARWLAESENGYDNENDRSDALESVLQDLSESAAKEASQNIGNKVLRSVRSVSHLHRTDVQKAGFVVLKAQEIPSILVETAFISNPDEERRLSTRAYQDKMAAAVFSGIMAHFRQYAPANTLMAQLHKAGKTPHLAMLEDSRPTFEPKSHPLLLSRNELKESITVKEPVSGKAEHVVSRGDTLLGLAQQYRISMRSLRTANNLADGNFKVGQVLQIPINGYTAI